MRFDLDDEQRAIKEAAHDLCSQRFEPSASAYGASRDDKFWPELTKSEWTQLCVPQRLGGSGAGVIELSLVVEELGYALAPATFLGNAAAGILLAAAGDAEQKQRLLGGVASGASPVAFAELTAEGGAVALDAQRAAALVVAGRDAAVLVEPVPNGKSAQGIDITRTVSVFDTVDGTLLPGPVAPALDRIEVLVAAELVGVAQHAMELAVEYARQRQQFGRPVGAYQAVSHKCADMLVLIESARSAVLSAAWTADWDAERLPFAASVAKVAAADAAWHVAAAALQVHGGIGFTWEHPIHLFLRRAAASSRLLGSRELHLDRIAALSGLGVADGSETLVPPERVPVQAQA